MRIIAGEYRGRRLLAPEGKDIRPTTDKTREALFSILMNEIPDARVLDLFAGTGALGIEALSRGAAGCTFIDQSRAAVRLIRENLAACGPEAERRACVCAGDFRRVLAGLDEPFDIILMDPPYGQRLWRPAMEIIAENRLLTPGGVLVCEHRREEELPGEIVGFVRQKERRYGISKLSIYRCYAPDDMII